MRPQPLRSRREAGFSFVEVLVVMGIIAVLAGLGTLVVQIMIKRQPKIQTESTINKVAALTNAWKMRHGVYPPMRLADIQKAAGDAGPLIKHTSNGENDGIETLYQALYWRSFGTDPELSEEKELANLDDDKLAQAATTRGVELREIIDGWGNPLVYFVNTAYVQADRDPPTYLSKRSGAVQPRPWKEEAGGFVNPNGFQLFSMGEDGQPNTEDDIKGW
jgi:prepilin-type N-terminal cleavage/methylation domain-containing protein